MTAPAGLSRAEAARRLAADGPNELGGGARLRWVRLLLRQFANPIMLLLLGATAVSMLLGDRLDGAIILAIVVPTALLGFFQERRAGDVVQDLLDRVKSQAEVIRDGECISIPAREVVRGDLVVLRVGSAVPADLRLLAADRLEVDESALTGESIPVDKGVAEPANQVFLGTHVVGGDGIGEVAAVGRATRFGGIVAAMSGTDPQTSFERGAAAFGGMLMRVMLALVSAIFVINLLLQRPLVDALLFSLALAVGLTPQLLTVITTVSLSAGARLMAARGVLVKRLDAIEDFGSMTVLCTDKTGTLTTGSTELVGWLNPAGDTAARVLELAVTNSRLQTGYPNPLDSAILRRQPEAAVTANLQWEIPYDFERRRLSVIVTDPNDPGSARLICKGAFEEVLAICATVRTADGSVPVAKAEAELRRKFAELCAKGRRVLLVATADLSPAADRASAESGLTAEGLLVFEDPLKPSSAASVRRLAEHGIRIVMLTGDNPLTASALAEQAGIGGAGCLTGAEVSAADDLELARLSATHQVFAAMDPLQKARVVRALQAAGETVGHFGDGVNDVLALRAADVGLSVDGALDVARDAADIVLLSKDLEVLAEGVERGRATFANTMKYIRVTISASFGNVVSMVAAAAFLPFLPLLPAQILLVNLLSDFPHLAIAADRVDEHELKTVRRWDIPAIRRFMLAFGAISTVFDLLTFWLLIAVFEVSATGFHTAWFIESILTELIAMLVLRTALPLRRSRPGRLLAAASVGVAAVTVALPWTPAAAALGLAPLTAPLLMAIAAVLLAYLVANEVAKRRVGLA